MKHLILAVFAFFFVIQSQADEPKGLVVLVPGLFNQLLPQAPKSLRDNYPPRMVSSCFSEVLIQELVSQDYDVLAFPPLK